MKFKTKEVKKRNFYMTNRSEIKETNSCSGNLIPLGFPWKD